MRVADSAHGKLLHPGAQRLEVLLGGLERTGEGRLIAAIEGGEVDRLDGGVQLLPPLGVAFRKADEQGFGGEDLFPQQARIGLPRCVNEKLGADEPGARRVVRPDGHQHFLPRDRLIGDEDRIEQPALALRHQRAVEEHARIAKEPQREADAGAVQVSPPGGGRDLDVRAVPARLGGRAAGRPPPRPPKPPKPPLSVIASQPASSRAGSSGCGRSAAWKRQSRIGTSVMACRRSRVLW